MKRWLGLCLCLLAVPLWAENNSPEFDDPVDRWNHFEVGGVGEGQYLPLTLGRDRTGFGLRARGSTGWHDNIFLEDRNEDNALFIDGFADAYHGLHLGLLALGVRGQVAGRMYFGEPEASLWDLKLGAFVRVPYAGGLGFGVSADVLFQQLQAYDDLGGPIIRRDAFRNYSAIGRAHFGVGVGEIVVLELGVRGQFRDFTEESDINSLDSWQFGGDAQAYFNILNTIQLNPYVAFDYEEIRSQPIGLILDDEDEITLDEKLKLLKYSWGVNGMLDFGFLRAVGKIYGIRQDDNSEGFFSYWQYGIQASADIMLEGGWRLTVGGHGWDRRYDESIDSDEDGNTEERYLRAFGELAWNFWEKFHVGVRHAYTRRVSSISNGGYASNETTIFLELIF